MSSRFRARWLWLALLGSGLSRPASAQEGAARKAPSAAQAPSAPGRSPAHGAGAQPDGTGSTPPAASNPTSPHTPNSKGPSAPASTSPDEWNQPFEPFRVIGNVYYVGARGVSAFFIHTPAGAILLDGGLPETAPMIEQHIRALGFGVKDVKILLNSHAHFDHAGGLAALQKAAGARVVASQGDAPVLRAGADRQPPVRVDRIVADGDTVELGGTVLTAHVTPGHTQGCTTWTTTVVDGGRSHPLVFYCSTSVVDRLLNNPRYPSIVADYERSFAALRALPCDVFLAPHGDFFQLAAKRDEMRAGGPNPFIDPGELRRFVDRSEQSFREALAKERAEPAPVTPPRS